MVSQCPVVHRWQAHHLTLSRAPFPVQARLVCGDISKALVISRRVTFHQRLLPAQRSLEKRSPYFTLDWLLAPSPLEQIEFVRTTGTLNFASLTLKWCNLFHKIEQQRANQHSFWNSFSMKVRIEEHRSGCPVIRENRRKTGKSKGVHLLKDIREKGHWAKSTGTFRNKFNFN